MSDIFTAQHDEGVFWRRSFSGGFWVGIEALVLNQRKEVLSKK
ncbi:MAG: hypothetical protein OEW75_07015 [Cyclobacteriaceae bacterium]|nr:hypothetical protein [Cyclobacteriaceae bacterium]